MPDAPPERGGRPAGEDLAIPGYDQLAASQVVARLSGLSSAAHSTDWLTRLDSASTAVLAGCIDDVAVGVLLASRRELIDQRLLARIDLVFVDPEARDVGVGEALVHGAAAWAVASGCIGLDGLALPGDRQTKNLYERAGMTAREITVYRELAP